MPRQALALLMAHADLEDLTLERDVAHEKARLEGRYAELVYDGLWFSPLKGARWCVRRREPTVRHGGRAAAVRAARVVASWPGGAARWACTTTPWPRTRPPIGSATRMREGFVQLWGLGVATWAARQVDRASPSRG